MFEAVKHDAGKPRLDLIPPEVMLAMGRGFEHGVHKYAARNWEKGMEWGRWYAALQRHLWAWWAGQEVDTDSGLDHLDHAATCMAVLVALRHRNIGTDDRSTPRWKVVQIMENADPQPPPVVGDDAPYKTPPSLNDICDNCHKVIEKEHVRFEELDVGYISHAQCHDLLNAYCEKTGDTVSHSLSTHLAETSDTLGGIWQAMKPFTETEDQRKVVMGVVRAAERQWSEMHT